MTPALIVTGPGRSGTSAVARVLHESGFPMGDALAPASRHNERGFYEDTAVVELNERIFDDCGMAGMQRWPSRGEVLDTAARYRDEMRRLVAVTAARGWKDPRFCLTLEAWLPHFASPPRVVVCLRSPEAFVQSAVRAYGVVPREPLEDWWAGHLRRALDTIAAHRLDATCVVYNDLIARPRDAVRALSRFVAHPLDARYVEPDLRHHAQRVPPHHRPLYDEVRALAWAARSVPS